MKVYVLIEYDIESSEIIDIFDALENAQSYENGKPEDWISDPLENKWWSRTIITSSNTKRHFGISEWKVTDEPKFEVGDIVSFVNKNSSEEFANCATIKEIEPLPTYRLEDDDGRGWINVKQDELTIIKKGKS